ncbi:NAD(P)-binding protein [Cylindrobasidium torrendii FP15055 ss-10]|uniref:NAD(P)-binding protein n=1 Tax=Cylindrobasidium torrendii FP15055 ss-10 TaxID=1314674 RepID=A0A0D7BBZ1_9AGAR|nr:NAD(P)-binding protein [Cylindrobasidium torrendii FP15055 ss-10]
MSSIPTSARQFYYPITSQGWDKLKQRTVPIPKLRPTEILVKVHAVSLQYRDLLVGNGKYPFSKPPPELVPCSDMAGEVVAVGEDAQGPLKVGDRVVANFITTHLYGVTPKAGTWSDAQGGDCQGVLEDYKTYKPESLIRIPDHLSYEEASTLPCAAVTAYNALLGGRKPLKAGDTVLILGTGGVSIFGLQFAVASGATVIVTSSSDAKLEQAKVLGATHGVNYRSNPAWSEEVLRLTNGEGVDHILEVSGETIKQSFDALKVGGQINVIAAVGPGGRTEALDAQSMLGMIIIKAANVRGINIGSVELFEKLLKLMAANPEKTRPVIAKVFGFNQTIEAFDGLDSQKYVGKIVISLDE